VVVISYRAWETDFARDPSIVGATIYVQTHPFTIAGVTPTGFFGDRIVAIPPDFWMPLQTEPLIEGENSAVKQSNSAWLYAVGRLRPGVNLQSLQAKLSSVLRQWMHTQPAFTKNGKTRLIAAELSSGAYPWKDLHYSEDPLPRGPAGCLRDLQEWLGSDTFIAIQGTANYNFDLPAMIDEHRRTGAAITVDSLAPMHIEKVVVGFDCAKLSIHASSLDGGVPDVVGVGKTGEAAGCIVVIEGANLAPDIFKIVSRSAPVGVERNRATV